MLTKIKRQDCLDTYQSFPWRDYDNIKDEETFFYPKIFANHILTLNSKSFKGHLNLLSTGLVNLTNDLGLENLIFLGDTKTAWLYQDNDYRPVKEAQQFLLDNKVGKRFNGAIQVDPTSLPIFIRHLSWLTRCNAALPYIHFIDEGQNLVGNICKYGNLHIDTLNSETDTVFKTSIAKNTFISLDGNSCSNQFGKTSAISGRQTTA